MEPQLLHHVQGHDHADVFSELWPIHRLDRKPVKAQLFETF
jgi:hypothetical protein